MIPILDSFTNSLYQIWFIIISTIIGATYALVVRVRVNYTPRELVLSGAVPNGCTGFFQMASRVKRIQGFVGFFRGAWPIFLLVFVINIIAASPLRYFFPRWLFQIILTVFDIPVMITLHRAIATPNILYLFQPIRTLKLIYTPYELRKPYILFFTPGVFVAESLRLLFLFAGLGMTRHLLFSWGRSGSSYLPYGLWVVVAIAGTVLMTPLDVVVARLSVQFNHDEGGIVLPGTDDDALYTGNRVVNPVTDGGESAGVAGDETVVCLRQDTDRGPYEGWADCVRKIWREEGPMTLWRGWGWTLTLLMLYGLS